MLYYNNITSSMVVGSEVNREGLVSVAPEMLIGPEGEVELELDVIVEVELDLIVEEGNDEVEADLSVGAGFDVIVDSPRAPRNPGNREKY